MTPSYPSTSLKQYLRIAQSCIFLLCEKHDKKISLRLRSLSKLQVAIIFGCSQKILLDLKIYTCILASRFQEYKVRVVVEVTSTKNMGKYNNFLELVDSSNPDLRLTRHSMGEGVYNPIRKPT